MLLFVRSGSARERYNVTGFLKCATQSNSDRSLLFGIYRTSCRKTSSIFADAVARVCASVRGFEEVLFQISLNVYTSLTLTDTTDTDGFQRGCRLEGLHPLLIVTYKQITVSVSNGYVFYFIYLL